MKNDTHNSVFYTFCEYAGAGLLLFLTLILPLKFGGLAAMPEAAGYFPEEALQWVLVTFPVPLFGILSAAALLFLLPLFFRIPVKNCFSLYSVGWTAALPLAAVWGCWRSPYSFYSLPMCWYLLGISLWFWGVRILTAAESRWKKVFFNCFAVSVILVLLSSFYQWFWGLDNTLNYVMTYESNSLQLSEAMLAKLADRRLYGPMASANLLSGFMLAAIPVFVVVCGKWSRNFEPQKLSLQIFCLAALLSSVSCLALTKTRGAFAAALAVTALAVFSYRQVKAKYKILLAGVIFFCAVAGAWYIQKAGRGFSSAGERVDYLQTCAGMIADQPLAGHGWGSFFYHHMEHKTTSTDEAARDPHNIAASFAVACGVWAIAVVLLMVLGLWKLWKNRYKLSGCETAVLWGCAALFLHMASEITMLSPAVLGTGALLIALVLPVEEKTLHPRWELGIKIAVTVILSGAAIGVIRADINEIKGEAAFSRLQDYALPNSASSVYLITDSRLEAMVQEVERYRPGYPFALVTASRSSMSRGKLELAQKYLEQALARDPERAGYHWQMAQILAFQGRTAEAALYRERARQLFPSNPTYRK